MSEDSAGWWGTPGSIQDSLTELLRRGARGWIEKAVEAELRGLLDRYENVIDRAGRQAVVRNGDLPERALLTGLGPGPVRIPKVRDRTGSGIQFNSALVPPYVRKAQRVEAAWPGLYVRGISTGDLQEALSVLLGEEAKGLSPTVVSPGSRRQGRRRMPPGIAAIRAGNSMSTSGRTGLIPPCAARTTACVG